MAGARSWRELPDTFTTRTARARGVHPRNLYAWRDGGEIVELSRGVFRRADAPPASYPDLLAVAYRAPRAIVCCMSAAAVHDLTDEIPTAVQIAVPTHHRPPQITYPPTEVLRFDVTTFELGLSSAEAAPEEQIRIYDPARTVVDLMRLRHRLGEPLAHAALRRTYAAATHSPHSCSAWPALLTYMVRFGPRSTWPPPDDAANSREARLRPTTLTTCAVLQVQIRPPGRYFGAGSSLRRITGRVWRLALQGSPGLFGRFPVLRVRILR